MRWLAHLLPSIFCIRAGVFYQACDGGHSTNCKFFGGYSGWCGIGGAVLCLRSTSSKTVFTHAPPPLVLADAAAATVFTRAPPTIVFAEASTAAVFTAVSLSLVFANAAAAAVFALAPRSLVLTDAAAATVFTVALPTIVLAEAAATAFFTSDPPPLVLAEAASTTVFTLMFLSLVLADAAAATIFTRAPPSLVLAQVVAMRLGGWSSIKRLVRCVWWAANNFARALAVCALIWHSSLAPSCCGIRMAKHFQLLPLIFALVCGRRSWRTRCLRVVHVGELGVELGVNRLLRLVQIHVDAILNSLKFQ